MRYETPVAIDVRGEWHGGDLALPRTRFVTLAGRTELVVFVHGFNNSIESAMDNWDIACKILRNARIPPHKFNRLALFYWPGDEKNAVFSKLRYFDKIEVAIRAGEWLADYLAGFGSPQRPLRLSIVGHSLGCRVALSALRALGSSASVQVQRVVLMAAAVPEGLCEPGRVYGTPCAESEHVMFSAKDEALGTVTPRLPVSAFRIGQFMARHAPWTARDEQPGPNKTAVGLNGQPRARWNGETVDRQFIHGQYWVDDRSVLSLLPVFDVPANRRRSAPPPKRRTVATHDITRRSEPRRRLRAAV